MKKLLGLLSSLSVIICGLNTVVSFDLNTYEKNGDLFSQDILLKNYKNNLNSGSIVDNSEWIDVGIDQYLKVGPSGTHHDRKTDTTAISADLNFWNAISGLKTITALGSFKLWTHRDKITLNKLKLNLLEDRSNDLKKVWYVRETHEASRLWAHQKSEITLEVIAEYNENLKIVTLNLSSEIYARTAGAVNVCQTFCTLSNIKF